MFFERDQPFYAAHRDLDALADSTLYLYRDWSGILPIAERELGDAEIGMVTSYCPDAVAAADLVLDAKGLHVFYDLDTPVTLHRLSEGQSVDYIPPRGLRDFDLVLSYTGGRALSELQARLGARRVAPLYGSVDPSVHRAAAPRDDFAADLSYLGTYAEDRNRALQTLFVDAARRLPERRFIIGGSLYEASFPWQPNIKYVRHVPPPDHPPFYCSSRLTLSVTRGAMAAMGYCPSGRLFEAAACRVPVLSDAWEGIEQFFEPGGEILLADSTDDTIAALERDDLEEIGEAAYERVMTCHTADIRARQLEEILETTYVGYHPGGGQGQPDTTVGVFEGTVAARQS